MKTVIEMALDTGFDADDEATLTSLERFATLVAEKEREALVDDIDWTALMRQGALVTWDDAYTLGDRVVDAIRARSNT